jgi:hypothetical protein
MRGQLRTVTNAIREGDGSFEYTIPITVARELELEDGDVPEIEWDSERDELTLSFKTQM